MAGNALHGVNLTGWLTLETWVTPELFAPSAALDEPSLITALGRAKYRELVEKHRAGFIVQADFARIAARGFNAVRLPLPWYAFCDEASAPGSYVPCAEYVDAALDWAEEIGLKLVFALAISPGNGPEDGPVPHHLCDLRTHRDRALAAVAAIAGRYQSRVGFFGVELALEPKLEKRALFSMKESEGVPQHVLRNYYREGYEAVRALAGDEPVVIMPDGGQHKLWRSFMAGSHYSNVWLDCQLAQGSAHDAAGPAGVRRLAAKHRQSIAEAKRCGMPVMVGAWSASLPVADAVMTPEGRKALERIYISEQLALYEQAPAWFFQTWKTSGLLASWDARVAFATFERSMLA